MSGARAGPSPARAPVKNKMLLVKTKLDVSRIHGIGLFADQFISKDTVVWKFNRLIDLVFTAEQLDELAPDALAQIKKYSYRDVHSGLYVLCGDDARFFNHSTDPNCLDTYESHEKEGITFACRDIIAGEELTCDYALFDLDFDARLYASPPHGGSRPRYSRSDARR
ncbi:MAG TPA: SET domain-containing protein [Pyrinomonadaceae bacterium]|jgi:SET domain-containing protein